MFEVASPYQKADPGVTGVRVTDPEDESILLDLELDLAAETKTTLLLPDLSEPIVVEDAVGIPEVEDAVGIPEVKTAWLRFANLASEPADLTLPEGGKVWLGGERAEVEEGGRLFEGVDSREVTDYVAAYSGELKVLVFPGIEENLELGDEGVYTLVLIDNPEKSEKKLVLLIERFEE